MVKFRFKLIALIDKFAFIGRIMRNFKLIIKYDIDEELYILVQRCNYNEDTNEDIIQSVRSALDEYVSLEDFEKFKKEMKGELKTQKARITRQQNEQNREKDILMNFPIYNDSTHSMCDCCTQTAKYVVYDYFSKDENNFKALCTDCLIQKKGRFFEK